MPFKFHASRRHHIPRAKYRVMNWPDYDRGLVRRGDIRFWIDESALEQWDAAKRRTPGGQRRFSELAISTTLMLGVVFRLPLRQTEGFVRSLVDLMGCDLPVPDHTTLSRPRRTVDVVVETSTNKRSTDIVLDSTGLKFFGAGEWARAKHGETRRSWRKLHISVDPASSEIRTHELTGDDTADATMAGPLVAGSGGMIRRVFANGAYDGEPVTKAIREARPPNSPPEIIIPPRATSIPPPDTPHGGSEREHHAAEIASKGRMNWQKRQGYGLRALGETAMARVKRLNGGKLNARTFQSQQTEIAMQIDALNRCIRAAKPNTMQDPLTNRGMGEHTIAAPCTKAPDCGSVNTVSVASRKPMPCRCRDCRRHFSVRKGTVMQSSKLGLQKWAIALYMMTTGIKGTSSMKLYREVGIRQATAWFLMQRIREGFLNGCDKPFLGPVEADETYIGGKRKNMPAKKRKELTGRGTVGKVAVAGVKDRGSKQVSAAVVEKTDAGTLQKFVSDRTEPTAMVYTDESVAYVGIPRKHEAVNHSVGEYVRGEATTNGLESFWSLFKRGYHGTFHHLSEKHLDRYVREFAGRNNIRDLDTIDQMAALTRGFVGKRLRYQDLVA